jgi:hypothetical protein
VKAAISSWMRMTDPAGSATDAAAEAPGMRSSIRWPAAWEPCWPGSGTRLSTCCKKIKAAPAMTSRGNTKTIPTISARSPKLVRCNQGGAASSTAAPAGGAGPSGSAGGGFATTIRCPQRWQVKPAALPWIRDGTTLYFFPHSSQMTITWRYAGAMPAPPSRCASWSSSVNRFLSMAVLFTRVFKNKHQAVSQGVRRFGTRSLFSDR